jgi:hypothetical protein
MNVARWTRRAAFTGAVAIAGAVALSAWTSPPSSAATRPNVFNVGGHAWGLQVDPDTNPEPFPIQNAFNEAMPYATSAVQAGGVSEADAQAFYAGFENTPALLCSFAGDSHGNSYCNQFPKQLQPFPPPYPFEAHASYPVQEESDAQVSGHQIGSGTSANSLTPGTVHATAKADSASGIAAAANGTFLPGTPLAVTEGSSSATTDQHFEGATAITRSIATVHDVTIAGLIRIASVTTVSEIDNDGTHPPVDKSSVVVSGATAGGLPATIDDKGIHLSSKGVAPTLFKQISSQVSKSLTTLGITVTAVGTQSTKVDAHTLQVQSAGVQVNFSRTFSEICKASAAICKFQPSIPNCTLMDHPPFNMQPLLNVCQPPVPNPRDTYLLTVAIGYSDAGNSASFYSYVPPNIPVNSGLPGPPAGGSSTTFIPGTPGTPGTPGSASLGGGGAPPPDVAGDQPGATGGTGATGYLENFGNVATRLKYLMPLLGLVAIGVLAGRLGRAPARLPAPTE